MKMEVKMNPYEEAKLLLKNTSERICTLTDILADDSEKYDVPKLSLIYETAARLQVSSSQLEERTDVFEGPCIVNNKRATVTIGGYEIRGNIVFEIQKDGKWVKGHRYNSQYGQTFIDYDGTSTILNDAIQGRVTHPLKTDDRNIM